MDIALQHVGQSLVNHAMSFNTISAGKRSRDDSNFEMPLAIASPGVPGVQVALVLDEQLRGIEGRAQKLSDSLGSFLAHGSTSLKGFTVTLE